MIDSFPEGYFIGELQAPFKWILSHTTRFQGIVVVKAGEGEGYVLIDRGKPTGCFFRLAGRELRGRAAFSHLMSLPIVNLSIRRYSRTEYEETLNTLAPYDPASPSVHAPVVTTATVGPEEEMQVEELEETAISPELHDLLPRGVGMEKEWPDEEAGPEFPRDLNIDTLAQILMGRILRLPGVQAVSIFAKGSSVISIGNVDLGSLVMFAEDILQAAKRISSIMHTGPFVHITLQIPAGGIIIAPYFDEYICILTGPEINLGQVRKILKEIPKGPGTGRDEY